MADGLPRGTPTPPRILGVQGTKLWVRVWALRRPWIDKKLDLDHVALLCESMDERVMLRMSVVGGSGAWRDRVALRQLDGQIAELMAALGLNPTDRKALRAVSGEGSPADDALDDTGLDAAVAGITQLRAGARKRRASAVDSASS